MKRNKAFVHKILAGVVAAAMLFAFAGCSDNNSENNDKKSVEDIMKTAQENMNNAQSLSYDMTMDMSMSISDQSVDITMTGTAQQIVDPMKLKMDMTMDMGELGSVDTQTYMAQENDKYYVYSGMDDGTGSVAWIKQEVPDAEELMQYNVSESYDLYFTSSGEFKEAGTETIEGKEATRYDGKISQEDMAEVIKASGTLDQFTALGVSEEDLNAMVNELGDMPISIWITNDDTFPVKYEMDMTEVMKNLMGSVLSGVEGSDELGFDISKVFLSMTVTGYNNVEDFEIPQEALSAEELSTEELAAA